MTSYQVNKKSIMMALVLSFIFLTSAFPQGKEKISELKTKIDDVVKTINCDVSIQVASATKYDLLYEYQPEKKMIPASISKVVTSAIALQYLGTGYEFKTLLYTDDSNLNDGVINGNLYIKGYGDS